MNLSGREGRDTPETHPISSASRLNPSLTKIFDPCRESTCFPYSRAKQTKTNLINSPFREGTFFFGGGGRAGASAERVIDRGSLKVSTKRGGSYFFVSYSRGGLHTFPRIC